MTRRGLALAALLALALVLPLAGCGKYGPPRRVHVARDVSASASADGSEAAACEDQKHPGDEKKDEKGHAKPDATGTPPAPEAPAP